MHYEKIAGRILKAHIRKHFLYLKAECPDKLGSWKGFSLIYRNIKKEEKLEYFVSSNCKASKNGKVVLEAVVDLKKIPLRMIYWDIYAVYENEENKGYCRLKNNSKLYKFQFKTLINRDCYKQKGTNNIVFPYLTRDGFIALQYRQESKYDKMTFRLKERIALALYILGYPFWRHKKIYLVYEKFCVMAQDNAFYFFQYCMENEIEKKMNRNIYYILDEESPDWHKISPYQNNVIKFGSIKHMVYLLAARLLISTDTRNHAYIWRQKGSLLKRFVPFKKIVFLQHGVTALKRVDFLYGKNGSSSFDLFIVTSDMEKGIVKKEFGYQEDEIALTGFARWDVLKDKSQGKREILVMPTWRNWLDDIEDKFFKKSEYYLNYMKLLNSNRMKEILEKYQITLNFYLHPKFRTFLKDFNVERERIKLIPFGKESLNELMMSCSMMVTDYSSACWDVFYQGKPVVFYQFDIETYQEFHGSYIDMNKDLFGERTTCLDELYDLIEKYAEKNFKLTNEYENLRKSYFKYIDYNNCQRICDEIMKKKW